MDLSGFETYIAYSLRGAIAQAEINDNSTIVGQVKDEEKKEESEQQAN